MEVIPFLFPLSRWEDGGPGEMIFPLKMGLKRFKMEEGGSYFIIYSIFFILAPALVY
jgi:hypothetical protein